LSNTRNSALAALCWAVLALIVPTGRVNAADEAEALQQVIRAFEDGEYLTAQELLAAIDRSKLDPELQTVRDDYLSRVQVAITMSEKALRDLEDAETAIAGREPKQAETLLRRVLDNEYAPEAIRRAAETHLGDLRRNDAQSPSAPPAGRAVTVADAQPAGQPATPPPPRSEPPQPMSSIPSGSRLPAEPATAPPPSMSPAQAQAIGSDADRAGRLTREGDDLVHAGRYAEARARFEEALAVLPGYPEAVDGLRRVQQHEANMAPGAGQSLAERIRQQDSINWQRTVALFRDAERSAREQVLGERFDDAAQLVIRARQIVESGRQFADPVTKFENLRAELEALDEYVRAEERAYNERQVSETRREIEEQRASRLVQVEENRARQVDALMQQALQHRKDGELNAAINVLKQVMVIDPKHQPARWMMDMLEDQRQYQRSRDNREDFYDFTRGALQDVEEAKIPWFEEITYPKDWLEIISREERRIPGEERRDSRLIGALEKRVPVDFRQTPFDQVIERLAGDHQLNLIVNWQDLGRAGVDRATAIDLSLPSEITLKKALVEVLEQAGGGVVDLGYDVADGAVTIATRHFLDKNTYPAVYNITDLLMVIPQSSNVPVMDLAEATYPTPDRSERADLPWQYGDDDDDEPEDDPERMDRIRKIIDLIQDTIAPESWRDRGGSVGMIKEINGQLVVTQNSAAHRQLRGLLNKLREERAIQVSVEALFITITSNYLEELGMDLDVILNAGNAGFDFVDSGQGPVVDPVLGNRLLLPRTFSRLGFTPNPPAGLGTATTTPGATVQPFTQPYLVPQQQGGSGSQSSPVPLVSNILDFTNPSSLDSDVPGSFAGQTIGPALSIFGSFLDNIQVDFLIRATQVDSRSSVLTAPRLVVFNGGSAWVAVTIQQNFIAQLQPVVAQGAAAQQPIVGTINAGASLFVRATVTADKRYVMMLLSPGVTRLLALQTFQFSGGTGAFPAFVQLPTLSAQRVLTVVSVPDGGTLLIGGQKVASETEVEAGVPILSKIPVLKRAYTSRSMVKDEQTLLILIKPKILIHTEQEELAFPSFREG